MFFSWFLLGISFLVLWDNTLVWEDIYDEVRSAYLETSQVNGKGDGQEVISWS